MDTKKNMSREQLLAYMRDNCTEAEAQQVRMWLRERLKDPGLDQLFSECDVISLHCLLTDVFPQGFRAQAAFLIVLFLAEAAHHESF